MPARYAIGIDLGTSNTALASADLAVADPAQTLAVFPVEQLVGPGEHAARELLPSAVYLPGEHELPPGALALPWAEHDWAVGAFALAQGARVPQRLVVSAKSWLCHPRVDRTARILPWGAAPELAAQRISPVEASERIVAHLREAWDAAHPAEPLDAQDVVLTVPASFDEVARELTVEAARRAGLAQLTLLEEPQAAFYDWTRTHAKLLRESLGQGESSQRLVLVVDVGGGTTDLTLVLADLGGAEPTFERVAVGDHLLLGGDNMDVALAHGLEPKLAPTGKLDTMQWTSLVHAARSAKELLLRADAPASTLVKLPGRGARLLGGALSAELSREEARRVVVDGFFPRTGPDDVPARGRTTGLAELGLPYASEPAITRHIAAFLKRHKRSAPDAVLFNGGALTPALVRERLVEVLSGWAGRAVQVLANDAPDLAVARGAAQFALARRGLGRRISGGSPRAYYIGLGGEPQAAVCVVPRGLPEGEGVELPARTFKLLLGKPARFELWQSTGSRTDRPGELVTLAGETADDLDPLPPLSAALAGSGEITVRLSAQLTAIGTLEIWCVGASQRWKLEFSLRPGEASRGSGTIGALPKRFEDARALVQKVFGKKPAPTTPRDVKDLPRALEATLGKRETWPTAVARELWGELWAGAGRRRRSAEHEKTWVQLTGYCLRPGFGYPLDDWRAAQLAGVFGQALQFHQDGAAWVAWWVMWRRVAGGLDEVSQRAIYESVAPWLRPRPARNWARPKGLQPLGEDELLRTLGALEKLAEAAKAEIGEWLLARMTGPSQSPVWALGRLGARVPLTASAHQVIAPELAARWVEALLALGDERWRPGDETPFAAAQLARRSSDRGRDLSDELRERVAARLARSGAPAAWSRQVREVVALEEADAERFFGESLPPGLKLS